MPLESYVVRIYRFPGGRRHGLVGIVEAEGTGGKLAFTCIEELWAILMERSPKREREAKPGNQVATSGKVTPIGAYVSRRSNEGEKQ